MLRIRQIVFVVRDLVANAAASLVGRERDPASECVTAQRSPLPAPPGDARLHNSRTDLKTLDVYLGTEIGAGPALKPNVKQVLGQATLKMQVR